MLVTFLLLGQNTTTKATCRRKRLFGFMVPFDRKYGSRQAWRLKQEAESSHLKLQAGGREQTENDVSL